MGARCWEGDARLHRDGFPNITRGIFSVVQTLPSLSVFADLLWWIRLQPLAEVAEHSRHKIEGDDHQDDNE